MSKIPLIESIQSGAHFATTRKKILRHPEESKIGTFFSGRVLYHKSTRVQPGVADKCFGTC